jgi:TatD DNase family protein
MNTTESKTSSMNAGPALAYQYQDALYLNITSRCPTACEFCIKFTWDYQYRGYPLLLKQEPSITEILAAVDSPSGYSEIVFCGYGESTYRLDAMKKIAAELRKRGAKKIRLNTIGLGSLIHKRNIAPDLAQFLDAISISLNTSDPQEWVKIHRPLPEFKDKGYEAVLDFIRECAKLIPQTYVTAIERPGANLKDFEPLVQQLGAKVRWRPYLDEYEAK